MISVPNVKMMEEGRVDSGPINSISTSQSSSSGEKLINNQSKAKISFNLASILHIFSLIRKKKHVLNQTIVRKLEDCAPGYPNLAAFLDSDDGFMVYRRFGFLQSRLLLNKQAELRDLEKKLDEIDDFDKLNNPIRLKTIDLKKEIAAPRQRLLEQIENKFQEYASLLVTAQQLIAFNKPAKCDYQSVRNFMTNNKPLVAEEAEWVDNKEDMITLRTGREHAWLDSSIELLLKWMQRKLRAGRLVRFLFVSDEERRKSSGMAVYFSRNRIERVAMTINIFAILVLLIVPIYVLYHLIADGGSSKAYAVCIGVLLVATLLFSAVVSLFTKAKRHEVLGAAAAYCAVLVVFIGNVNPNQGIKT